MNTAALQEGLRTAVGPGGGRREGASQAEVGHRAMLSGVEGFGAGSRFTLLTQCWKASLSADESKAGQQHHLLSILSWA